MHQVGVVREELDILLTTHVRVTSIVEQYRPFSHQVSRGFSSPHLCSPVSERGLPAVLLDTSPCPAGDDVVLHRDVCQLSVQHGLLNVGQSLFRGRLGLHHGSGGVVDASLLVDFSGKVGFPGRDLSRRNRSILCPQVLNLLLDAVAVLLVGEAFQIPLLELRGDGVTNIGAFCRLLV